MMMTIAKTIVIMTAKIINSGQAAGNDSYRGDDGDDSDENGYN